MVTLKNAPRQHFHDSFLDGNTLAGLLLVEESCICAGVHVHVYGFTPCPELTPLIFLDGINTDNAT